MANSKDIELIIKAKNLASKPVGELDKDITQLVTKVESLAPASERGEVSLKQLESVASQLGDALRGLLANQSIIERFKLLSSQFDEAGTKLQSLKEKADQAKLALSQTANPGKDLFKASSSADAEVKKQESALARLSKQLATVSEKANAAGLDLNQLSAAEQSVDAALAKAQPAYERINKAMQTHAEDAARAAATAKTAAEEERRAAQVAADAQERANQRTREGVAALDAAVAAKQAEDAAMKQQAANRQKSADAFWAEVKAVEARRNAVTASVVAENEAATAAKKTAEATRQRALQQALLEENLRRGNALNEANAGSQKKVETSTKSLTQAYREMMAAFTGLANARTASSTSERTTTDVFRGLRAQVTSLIAAYAGLYGAINSVSGILDVVQKRTAIKGTFDVAFGPEAADQMKEVEKTADKLGFRFLDLAQSYGKFAVASKSVGTSTKDTQTIFEAFASVSRAAGLDTERTKNVFVALEQIMSKGKFAMEELRGQLGDALPGALGTLSDALKIPQADLLKLIENGKLSSKFLLNFALEYKTKFAGAISTASASPAAALGRFQSALDKLKETIANGGFLTSFTELLKKLTDFFKSPDGEKFAKAVSLAFKGVAQALIFVVDNARILAAALAVVFGTKFILSVVSLSSELATLARAMGALVSVGVASLVTGFKAIEATFRALIITSRGLAVGFASAGVAAAALAGFFAGKWLSDAFPKVRQFGVVLVGIFVTAFSSIKDAAVGLWESVFDDKTFVDNFARKFNARMAILKDQFDEAGQPNKTTAASTSTSFADDPRLARIKQRSAELEAEQSANKQASENLKEIAQATADAQLKAANVLQDKLDNLRAESLKKDSQTREQYLAGVRLQFKDLEREITDFGKTTSAKRAAQMKADLEQIIKLRVDQAGAEFDTDKAKRAETEINDLVEKRKALIADVNALRKGGAISDAESAKRISDLTSTYNGEIEPKVRALIDYIASLPQKTQQSLAVLASNLDTLLKTGLNDSVDNSEFLTLRRKAELILLSDKSHTDALQLQKQLVKSHAITQTEYNAAVDKLRTQYAGVLTDSTALLDAIKNSTTLTDEQRDALAAVIQQLDTIKFRHEQITEAEARARALQEHMADELSRILLPTDEQLKTIRNIGDAWIAVRDNMRTYAADLLRFMAQYIIKQQILNALKAGESSSGGSIWGTIGSAAVAALANHTGGVVGRDGSPRTVAASWFANAPRYHSGGLPGLSSNEVATILKKKEEVLTEDDPRNVLNGGGGGRPQVNLQIHNAIDSGSLMEQGAATAAGGRAILNVVRANKSALKQLLK